MKMKPLNFATTRFMPATDRVGAYIKVYIHSDEGIFRQNVAYDYAHSGVLLHADSVCKVLKLKGIELMPAQYSGGLHANGYLFVLERKEGAYHE